MFFVLCGVISFISVTVIFVQMDHVDTCKLPSKKFVRQMAYNGGKFSISLHDPELGHVISKSVLASGHYASVDEIQNICAHGVVQCGEGRLFVEVGSAVGMVSLYAASRGMRVRAFDPIGPNVDRVTESQCLNGEAHCHGCADSSKWGPFAPERFNVKWTFVDMKPSSPRTVASRRQNMAATAGGGGKYHAVVNVTSIGAEIDTDIEVLLLTCQGFEYRALLGADYLLRKRKIRSIIWRRHSSTSGVSSVNVFGKIRMLSEQDANAAKIAELLLVHGYIFYNIESKTSAPTWISPSELTNYVLSPLYDGAHPNILSVLGK